MTSIMPLRVITSLVGLFLGYLVGNFLEHENPKNYNNYDRVMQQVCINLAGKFIEDLDSSDEDDFDCLCDDYDGIASSDEETLHSDSE